MIIKTENSVFEVDVETKHIRRVEGTNPPNDRFKEDGVWHEYHVISDPKVGNPLVIVWESMDEIQIGDEPMVLKSALTITSEVTDVREDTGAEEG